MIGTDFFLMMNLFPGRTRAELKVGKSFILQVELLFWFEPFLF